MQTNMDPSMGAGVTALDRSELQEIRGGIGVFWVSVFAGVLVAFIDGADDFIKGVKEGYAWARA